MKTNDTESTSKLTAEVFFRRRSQLTSHLTNVQECYKDWRKSYVNKLDGKLPTLAVAEIYLPYIEDLRITAQLIEEEIAELDRQWNPADSPGLD